MKEVRNVHARRALILIPAALAAVAMPAAGAFEIAHSATFSPDDLTFQTRMGYDVVRMADDGRIGAPGEPMLPSQILRLAVPDGMMVTGVRVVDVQSVALDGAYDLMPVQPVRRVSDPAGPGDFVAPDREAYASTTARPDQVATFTHQTDLAGQAIAVVELAPLSYIPAEQRLILHTSIEFVLEGVSGYRCGDYLPRNADARERAALEDTVRSMVVNPEDVSLRADPAPPLGGRGVGDGDYDYVIVTQDGWVDDFQPLADWKTRKGVPANIVTLDWIYYEGGYSGDNQSKIRQFVQDARSSWGTMYFLLGGDTNVVPYYSRYLMGDSIPNDTYYGDYDSDWTCEVHVGRAAVRTPLQIDIFTDKVFTYEKDPPLTNYAKTVGLFGFDLYSYGSGEGQNCKADIDYLYIPNDWTMRKEYDSEGGGHKYDVIGYLNDGNNLVNHIDHCGEYSIGAGYTNHGTSLYTSDVGNLYNGDRQTIFYSIGCWPNAYDYYTCIAEEFVQNSSGGGIAFVGNSRYGWYSPYNDDYVSLRFDRYFFRSLLQQGNYILGDAFSDHKNDAYQYDDYYRYIFTEMTLLGDPELPVWTENPSSMTVVHDDTLSAGEETDFLVTVSAGGSPVLTATVCLWKGDEIYEIGATNGYGEAIFSITPETTGVMDVTVTAVNRDLLPYEGEAEVVEGGTPGDLDGDGDVDTADLLALLADWGCIGNCPGDVDGDGDTDTADLLMLLANWG
ncbi:MAG: C25 family cysteine peptidase [Planctomycetota bacterium]|nr:C25 family cysteine peptidase [Planctomycetota bacterium]